MTSDDDRDRHHAEARARATLRASGGEDLPRMPWQPAGMPPDDVALVRLALWRANRAVGSADHGELRAALRLLEAAKAEVEALEVGLLTVARMEGMTWSQVADGLGVRSPQAAQQRLQRSEQRGRGSARGGTGAPA